MSLSLFFFVEFLKVLVIVLQICLVNDVVSLCVSTIFLLNMFQEVVVLLFFRLLSLSILIELFTVHPLFPTHRSHLPSGFCVIHYLIALLVLFEYHAFPRRGLILSAESARELFKESPVFVVDAVPSAYKVIDGFLSLLVLRLAGCKNIVFFSEEEGRGRLLTTVA